MCSKEQVRMDPIAVEEAVASVYIRLWVFSRRWRVSYPRRLTWYSSLLTGAQRRTRRGGVARLLWDSAAGNTGRLEGVAGKA